jgi:flagellar FliL protein
MAGENPHDLEFVEARRASTLGKTRGRIVWAVSLVLLVIAIGVGYIALTAREKRPLAAVPAPAPVFLDLPAITVNLADEKARALTLAISLEVSDPATGGAVQAVLPYLFDSFQTHLRELRATEIEGAAGLFRLREELTKRTNLSIAPRRVRAVLVREMQLR